VSLASEIMNSGDVWAKLAELGRKIDNLTSGRRLEDASIGARGIRLIDEGGMTINGGFLRMTDETGSVGLLYFGPNSIGSGRVWQFSFPSGEVAFGLISTSGDGFWGGNDQAGNLILSNDAQTGVGLARPYVPLRLIPSGEAQLSGTSFWPSHTNTSFTRVMYGFNPIFHPKVEIGVATATAGSGSAEWRLLLNGTDVTGTVSGGASRVVSIPDWGEGVLPGHTVEFSLELRIAGGGTRAFAQCDKLFARQS
jgi:hypothetical protein